MIRRDLVDQLEQIAIFAARMGAASLHFVHVMPTSNAVADDSALSLEEQRAAEQEIAILARIFKMKIGIDVGYYNIDEDAAAVFAARGREHKHRLSRAAFAVLQSFRVSWRRSRSRTWLRI